MKLSMAQIQMTDDIKSNEKKTMEFCDAAGDSDLLFFPEIQYSPFFPQYPHRNAEQYLMKPDGEEVARLRKKAQQYHYYLSPNLYLQLDDGKRYDSSLWIDPDGQLVDIATMVHIFRAPEFYETDYYAPSRDGFKVFTTPFGKVGIVICFDRHFPESVRTCAALGADLVIIPTANLKSEPLALFQSEIQVLSMQNRVFIAMCNRVGKEGNVVFAGESLVTHPSGEVLYKAGDKEELITVSLNLSEAGEWKKKYPFLGLRRPECYR
ncbi:MAG: carbon-nitrogen hydrolase family protein [Acidaminococcus sp.]|jgi:N-carbamoylputrescine amidase|nr:carbon-nitrogen hydrolase family protein [Acidaminococcus sp.]MCI2100075.1 carbon-nitrogen hydrolase family protein [Acidaminococcus sp.]MCI2114327.1 carbon-nitrogen hydrolase family protein [Acidaminococcus sp.]MCI2116286.1 carbon-nitrogen hydrolase family protein [Acidaminococcus sp.]